METPWLHGNFKSDNKAWIELTVTMGHTYNANRYFTVHYKKLGDSSWTSIGNFTGSSSSMKQTRYIDTTNKPFSTMLKLRFTAVTNDTDYTPILLDYKVKSIPFFPIRKITHAVIRCANEIVCKQEGQVDKGMYNTIKSTLDNARNNAIWLVPIRDIDGDTKYVKFLPVSTQTARMLVTRKEKGREQERHYHVLLLEQALS
jgi:hypothetical protein